jgi:hypothetical protein
MIEAAVAVVLLATLLGALPILLAYHDIQRAVLRGARDAAMLASWRGGANPDALHQVVDGTLEELPWRHPSDGVGLIDAPDARRAESVNAPPPGRAAAMLQFIAAPLRASDGFLGEQFELSQRGFRQVRVDVRVPAIRGAVPPFSSMVLNLTGDSAMLTDAWNAAGSTQVNGRVAGLVPTRRLESVQSGVHALGSILRLIEPAFEQLCPGLIEGELVPASRLGDARVARAVPAAGGVAGGKRCR